MKPTFASLASPAAPTVTPPQAPTVAPQIYTAPANLPAIVQERSFKRFVLSFTNEQTITLTAAGDFVFLERARTNTGTATVGALWGALTPALTVQPDSANVATPVCEGQLIRLPTPFTNLQIRNPSTSETAVRVIVWVGFGEFSPAYANRPPAMYSHYGIMQAPNSGAYAVNDAIGSSRFDFYVFPDAYSHLRIVRARLSYDLNSTTLANFRAYICNDDTALAPTDNAQLVIGYSEANAVQGIIEFASFINDGVTAWSHCDVSGINMPITKGIAGTFPERLRVVLVARAAWNPAAIVNYRLDLTVSQ